MDQLEGHPRWYRREEIPIVLDDGKEITAWLYFMNGGFPDENHIEKSGDFEKARGY